MSDSEAVKSDDATEASGEQSEQEPEETTKDVPTKKGKATKKEKGDKPAKAKKSHKSTHPTTLDMVVDALEYLNEPQGASIQAIKSYILSNYPTVRPDMIKHMLKRGINAGLHNKTLERPKGQSGKGGLSGRYKLGSKHLAPESVPKGSSTRKPKPPAPVSKPSPPKKKKKKIVKVVVLSKSSPKKAASTPKSPAKKSPPKKSKKSSSPKKGSAKKSKKKGRK